MTTKEERQKKKDSAKRKLVVYITMLVTLLVGTYLASSSSPHSAPPSPPPMVSCPHSVGVDKTPDIRVFSKQELKAHDGSDASAPLLLGILGRVYDVSKAPQFYGKGGGYSFFSGIDGSAAFVTGEFNEAGLVESLDGLGDEDVLGVVEWLHTYDTGYTLVGVLHGAYYDASGAPTPYLCQHVRDSVLRAEATRAHARDLNQLFPPCNVRKEAAKEKAEVWCENRSGGIVRDYVGVIRYFYDKSMASKRCACVQDALLQDPRVSPFPNCPDRATHCWA